MSRRKILAALKKKNIPAERVEYIRGDPTPSGYADGWDIDMSEDTVDKLFEAGFIRCQEDNQVDTTDEAIEWIESMPALKPNN